MRTTFVSDVTLCPEKAAAVYFKEIPEDDTETDGTARGTAVHAGIEYALNYASEEGRSPSRTSVVEVVHTKLDELWPWREVKVQQKTTRRHANQMINVFLDEILPHVAVPAVQEQAFEIVVHEDDERRIILTGHIDCIDANGLVWDWKTTGQPYVPWEKQRWAVQPTAYTFGAWWLADEEQRDFLSPCPQDMPEQWFRYAIMLENGTVQYVDVARDGGNVTWMIEQMKVIARMIESEQRPWPLNDAGWHCSPRWCPKFAECKGCHMTDGWDQTRR